MKRSVLPFTVSVCAVLVSSPQMVASDDCPPAFEITATLRGPECWMGYAGLTGHDLNEQAGNFDIEKMNATLDAFPEMVASIQTCIRSKMEEKQNEF